MKVVVVGQGKMGLQISQMLIESGHQVVAMDSSRESLDKASEKGAEQAHSRQEAIAKFDSTQQKPVIWLMVPSSIVENEFGSWLDILPKSSVVVDGGNSDYRLSRERGQLAESQNIKFIDVGVSGGVLGLQNGFSMMVGGRQDTFETIEPLLKALSKDRGGYAYFGPDYGAGHFVKMVHNGIEYGMMESLAEGYRLLNDGPYRDLDLASVGDVWQKGSVISSELNALVAKALHENPTLDGVDGFVAESGEARWSLETARDSSIDMPAIQAALDIRLASQEGEINFATKLLAALRNQFGGHAINKVSQDR